MLISLYLTHHCNFNCIHCGRGHYNLGNDDLNIYPNVIKHMIQMGWQGKNELCLTGGEPIDSTLPWKELIIATKEMNLEKIHLVTNGTRYPQAVIDGMNIPLIQYLMDNGVNIFVSNTPCHHAQHVSLKQPIHKEIQKLMEDKKIIWQQYQDKGFFDVGFAYYNKRKEGHLKHWELEKNHFYCSLEDYDGKLEKDWNTYLENNWELEIDYDGKLTMVPVCSVFSYAMKTRFRKFFNLDSIMMYDSLNGIKAQMEKRYWELWIAVEHVYKQMGEKKVNFANVFFDEQDIYLSMPNGTEMLGCFTEELSRAMDKIRRIKSITTEG